MKRFFSVILAAILFISCCGSATAAHDIEPYASLTLSYYDINLSAGDSRGMLWIDFDVRSNKLTDSIGISKIRIYKSNGALVTTIFGSESNGLVLSDSARHNDTYEYTATSGTSYYAEVTVFATVGSITDSRTVTTSTEEAP